MKKKILFVFHCSSIGGGSWCLFEILRHLDRDRFEPIVLLSSEGPLVERIRALGIPVEVDARIPEFPFYANEQVQGVLRFIKALLLYPKGFSDFRDQCRRISPDVVYLNSSAQLFLPWPAKKAGVKRVILHSREHWEFKGLLKLKLYLSRWMIRRFVDRLFSITECGIKAIGVPEKCTVVRDWPSFDDETEFDVRETLRINKNKFIILLAGGFQRIKGTLDVLQALEMMQMREQVAVVVLGCSRWQYPRWKAVLKRGLNWESYADKVEKLAGTVGQVFLLPPTLQVKAYIRQCDVLVAPFTMPHAAKAALEAQLLGRPVVIYDCAEAREYVQHEETGLIVPNGDIKRLADTLDELVKHSEKIEQLGSAGMEFVGRGFSSAESMKKINEALKCGEMK
jgi:glycosyltransferase involved in cell wall biosynthesis